ncbi:shikimate dehydrogenase [Frondihabitans cladoniiphilus]|uniref:Shikimate dehydrogenase n=1 Tax=Frondihabitans cladoniiphilus TaxID=715785 RepID=A0ABP8W5Z1_9MICO
MRRLAVLGSPIAHSKSPLLHETAYRLLGLPFEYGRAEVGAGALPAFLKGLDDSWLGLSLTMPLKREVIPLLATVSPLAAELGVANTVVLRRDGERLLLDGHNTDVDGIVRALTLTPGFRSPSAAARTAVLGGGATAASAIAAAAQLGVTELSLYLRDPTKAAVLVDLGVALDVAVHPTPLGSLAAAEPWEFVISTLPGGVGLPPVRPASPDSVLLDVAYEPWPSPIAASWEAAGGRSVSGLDMLLEQAIGQVRLFTGGGQDAPLASEDVIRQAMRQAVGLVSTP